MGYLGGYGVLLTELDHEAGGEGNGGMTSVYKFLRTVL